MKNGKAKKKDESKKVIHLGVLSKDELSFLDSKAKDFLIKHSRVPRSRKELVLDMAQQYNHVKE